MPSKVPSACSSCSMAGRSRWLVGSSSTSVFTPRADSRASTARVRSPGDSDDSGRSTSLAPSPNLASSVRDSLTVQPGDGRERARQRLVGGRAASGPGRARPPRRPARARRRRRPAPAGPSIVCSSVVLPLAVRADQRHPVAAIDLEVDGPEPERRPAPPPRRSGGPPPSPLRPASAMARRSSHPSHGLSHRRQALHGPLGAAGVAGAGLGAGDAAPLDVLVVVVGPLGGPGHALAGPRPLAAAPLGQRVAPLDVRGVGLLGQPPGRRPLVAVRLPPAVEAGWRCDPARRSPARSSPSAPGRPGRG